MDEQRKPTAVGAVDTHTIVELPVLKTADGQPVCVCCETIPRLSMSAIVKRLPGLVPQGVDSGQDVTEEETEIQVGEMCEMAKPLIETGTWLVDEDGSEVRPAFYFDEAKPRHPRSLPGRILTEEDVFEMFQAFMIRGGYLGGAASAAAFHARQRAGADGRVGAVEVLPGGETDPPASD